ncbi:hypothetical protein Hamer_G001594 [Homarus americanus]|uniref:Uncharacterized protein n=1 Tax=Homarus americanus TaxID=6706 RepID=A0A8J5MQS7_HOMAM|nr:hypothetical protein Hamer_G001594 [Homarus americanus]
MVMHKAMEIPEGQKEIVRSQGRPPLTKKIATCFRIRRSELKVI